MRSLPKLQHNRHSQHKSPTNRCDKNSSPARRARGARLAVLGDLWRVSAVHDPRCGRSRRRRETLKVCEGGFLVLVVEQDVCVAFLFGATAAVGISRCTSMGTRSQGELTILAGRHYCRIVFRGPCLHMRLVRQSFCRRRQRVSRWSGKIHFYRSGKYLEIGQRLAQRRVGGGSHLVTDVASNVPTPIYSDGALEPAAVVVAFAGWARAET
jgi:hypothetical protein